MTNRRLNRRDRPDRATYRNVAELVRAFRACDLLTQHELAQRTGVTQAQLCRYEKGVQEPSLPTLRRMLDGLGWSLRLAIEPSTAVADHLLDRPFDALEHFGMDVPGLLEVAASAVADGADLVVGGEVAAVLQGVPVRTTDLVFHVRPDHVSVLVRAAVAAHRGLTDCDDDPERFQIHRGDVAALVAPCEVLPARRIVRLDFTTYMSGREVPVVDLEVLRDSGVLGPSGRMLAERMVERTGAESIP